jgi:DNA-binding MarR family transcriptional regulator
MPGAAPAGAGIHSCEVRAVREKKTEDRVADIERHIVDVRNLFIGIFKKLVSGVREDGQMAEMGAISVSQLKALAAFHEDREYSMSELSRNALVKMPSMTEMVDRMEAAGILERVRDSGDRRVVNVSLTERGKKIHQEFIERRRRELSAVFSRMDDADQEELLKALRTVSTLLQKVT